MDKNQPEQPSEIQIASNEITQSINRAMKNGVPPPQIVSILEYLKFSVIQNDLAWQQKNKGASARIESGNFKPEIVIENNGK